jgi:hypothetical protein
MFLPAIKTLCSIGNEFFCVATVRKLVGGEKNAGYKPTRLFGD